MEVLYNKQIQRVPVKIWSKIHTVESQALDQLKNISSLPFVFKHVAAMPDVHLGKGATVGSVIATKNAVIPAAVGVDIGCVDAETEFLSPTGWKKISEWSGDSVCQYTLDGRAHFVEPLEYISLPCERFWHIHTKYGVNLMVDDFHRHLVFLYDRSYSFSDCEMVTTLDIVKKQTETANGFRHRFLTAFSIIKASELDLSLEQLRVMVMVCADGHFYSENKNTCVLRFKKERKVKRAMRLLREADLDVTNFSQSDEGITSITFQAPLHTKTLSSFWEAGVEQLKTIADEVIHWDGNEEDQVYFTRDKASADFVHYVFSATGWRAVMREDTCKSDGAIDYRVFRHANIKVGINGSPKSDIAEIKGNFKKYCFRVPSGLFVIRRSGNVCITGNCGMMAVKLFGIEPAKIMDQTAKIRHSIERSIPLGPTKNSKITNTVDRWEGWGKWRDLHAVKEHSRGEGSLLSTAKAQLGSLGGGNHFIELCTDTEGGVWVMLHSGSRNIGKSLAEMHIYKAKELMKMMHITLPDPELAYFVAQTPEYDQYIRDLNWAQDYAAANREEMMRRVLKDISHAVGLEGAPLQTSQLVNCHHNYASMENHFNENVLVTRKGAVRARAGDLGIIPGSMGTRSYIVRGLGNPESYMSCSHGAGRRMSRGEAKRTFTLADLAAQTQGVDCRKDESVLDEIPGAYKDIDEVMENQKDLVEVVAQLKQFMCVKG